MRVKTILCGAVCWLGCCGIVAAVGSPFLLPSIVPTRNVDFEISDFHIGDLTPFHFYSIGADHSPALSSPYVHGLTEIPESGPAPPAAPELTPREVVQQIAPSIVNIDSFRVAIDVDPKTKQPIENSIEAGGTGFIVDVVPVLPGSATGSGDAEDEIYIVTNCHVATLFMDLKDGESWKTAPQLTVDFIAEVGSREFRNVELVNFDELADLAVLKVVAPHDFAVKHPAVRWADPNDVKMGDEVMAAGFPLQSGALPTITKGIISSLHRDLGEEGGLFGDLIQTDAAINHGNSGGPLLNMRGEVVGVNTYAYDDTRSVGFARSSRTAAEFVAMLERGPIVRPSLGVKMMSLDEFTMSQLINPDERVAGLAGVLVVGVEPGSPAEKAGLSPGDVILEIGAPIAGSRWVDHQSLNGVNIDYFSGRIGSEGDYNNVMAFIDPGATVHVVFIKHNDATVHALAAKSPTIPTEHLDIQQVDVPTSNSLLSDTFLVND